MSISPESLPAAPATEKEPFRRRKRGCENCGKPFWIETLKQKTKRFCGSKCRSEWNNYGAGIGPMKRYMMRVLEDRLRPRELQKVFAGYFQSRQFRLDLMAAGFIHRSQVDRYRQERERRRPELTAKGLKAAVDACSLQGNKVIRELYTLSARITEIETRAAATLDRSSSGHTTETAK